MPNPDVGLERAGMKVFRGEHRTAQQTVGVIVCACVSTGSHGVQKEEGRAGLVTERTDVPSMRRLGNCVGNPLSAAQPGLEGFTLYTIVQKPHNSERYFSRNRPALATQP